MHVLNTQSIECTKLCIPQAKRIRDLQAQILALLGSSQGTWDATSTEESETRDTACMTVWDKGESSENLTTLVHKVVPTYIPYLTRTTYQEAFQLWLMKVSALGDRGRIPKRV